MSSDPAVVEVLLEFLEAVIHQILFVREIYRAELFERQRLYGVAIRKARHPELCDYVHDVVASLKDPLSSGTLAKVVVVVLSPSREALERYIVEPTTLQGSNNGVGAAAGKPEGSALELAEVEAQLRGFVLKLQYIETYLQRLPAGCTFELVAYTAGRSGLPVDEWIEEQGAEAAGRPQLELTEPGAEIVPIKSCRIEGAFQLQLYAEGRPPG